MSLNINVKFWNYFGWFLWFTRYIAMLYIGAVEKDVSTKKLNEQIILENVPVVLPTMVPKVAQAEPIYYMFPYSSPSGTAQRLIHNAKFFGSPHAQWKCAKVLLFGILKMCAQEISNCENIYGGVNIVLVPVPSSPKNVRNRGYDQCLEILSYLKEISGNEAGMNLWAGGHGGNVPISIHVLPILGKRRFAIEQKKQNLEGRLAKKNNPLYVKPVKGENCSGEFLKLIRSLNRLNGKCVVCIIDDVVTTGVTIENARMCVRDFLKESLGKINVSDFCGEGGKFISIKAVAIAHEL